MTTSRSTIVTISFVLVFLSCADNGRGQNANDINFKDTLYEKHFSLANNGDTVLEYDTIYFVPTDLSVDTSGFFYQASTRPPSETKTYKIFFPRLKVISFCDSVLKTFPPNPDNQFDDYFYDRILYESIREQAANNEMNETVIENELSTLLERFSPFILNPITGDKPTHMIITKQAYTGETKLYQIKTAEGETILLTTAIIRPMEFEDMEQK